MLSSNALIRASKTIIVRSGSIYESKKIDKKERYFRWLEKLF